MHVHGRNEGKTHLAEDEGGEGLAESDITLFQLKTYIGEALIAFSSLMKISF